MVYLLHCKGAGPVADRVDKYMVPARSSRGSDRARMREGKHKEATANINGEIHGRRDYVAAAAVEQTQRRRT